MSHQIADFLANLDGAPLDWIPACISRVDRNEIYVVVNSTYEEWFRTPREQILGRSLKDVIGPAAYLKARPAILRVLSGERIRYAATMEYPTGPRRIRAVLEPFRGPGGGYWGLFFDQDAHGGLISLDC